MIHKHFCTSYVYLFFKLSIWSVSPPYKSYKFNGWFKKEIRKDNLSNWNFIQIIGMICPIYCMAIGD